MAGLERSGDLEVPGSGRSLQVTEISIQVEEEGTEAQTAKQSTQTSLSSVFNAFKESTRSGDSWDVDGTVQVNIVSGHNFHAI